MKTLIIIAIVHILLLLCAYGLSRILNENDYKLFIALCCIPIIGPAIVIWIYIDALVAFFKN